EAKAISTKGGGANYTITQKGADWQLEAPVRDRVDPDKLKNLLNSIPDLWAELFVAKGKDLADYGLKAPEETLRVTKLDGSTVAWVIGKESQHKERPRPRPPLPNPRGLPSEPQKEVIHEEYRYAKLLDNDQLFEIKADKLKEIFAAADTLRDPRLARFQSQD